MRTYFDCIVTELGLSKLNYYWTRPLVLLFFEDRNNFLGYKIWILLK